MDKRVSCVEVARPVPHGADLAAVFDGVGERRADAGIDLGMNDSDGRVEPCSIFGRPSGLERPDGGAFGKRCIEADSVETRDAGEYLAADAAITEETERSITLGLRIRDTKRSNRSASTGKRLRGLFLWNASVDIRFELTPEWTRGSGTRYYGVDGACDLEAIAAIGRSVARFRPEVILQVPAQILPDGAPWRQRTAIHARQQRREAGRIAIPEVGAEQHAAFVRRDNRLKLRADDLVRFRP